MEFQADGNFHVTANSVESNVAYEVKVETRGGDSHFAVDILSANPQVRLLVEVTQGSNHKYTVLAETERKDFNMRVTQSYDSSSEMSSIAGDVGDDVPQIVSFIHLTHSHHYY